MSKKVIRLHPKLSILSEKAPYKILSGGRMSMKSWGIGYALSHFSNTYSMRILCCREIQKSIKESSKKVIEDSIERLGLTSQYDIQETVIRHRRTKSEFIFEGLHRNQEKIKSYENISLAWVEEAETLSERSWDYLAPTIRRNKGSEIWLSYNPRYETDYVWKLTHDDILMDMRHVHLTYQDNPYLSDDVLAEIEKMRLQDPEKYRFIYLGEPLKEGDNIFITPKLIKDAQERIPLVSTEAMIAGLDVARYGGDDTVLVFRDGNRIPHSYAIGSSDLVTVSDWAANHIVSHGCKTVVVDGTGVGGGVVDMMRTRYGHELQIVEFNGAAKPQDERYLNLRTETWDRMRTWIRESGQLPKNDKADELSQITYFYNTQNRLQLESKEQMRRRGVPSPDWGDALSMTFADAVTRPKFDQRKFANALMRR